MNIAKIKKCLTCGGELVPNGKGIPTCAYCGMQYKEGSDGYSHELDEIVNRRQLREFIQAEELCKKLQQKQPESSEVYWQTLLSSLGVVYVQEENKAKPTFFSYAYDDRDLIENNDNYKNALKYAKTAEERNYYQEHGRELDTLLKAFFNLVAKEASYDIFISFKRTTVATSGGEEIQIDTKDYKKAQEIYERLSKKYRVFFSPVSIGQDTGIEGEKYEPRILKALQTSQAMVLLGSKTEYLESQWVQNEWKRYQYFISKGKKNKASLILGYEGTMPSLPVALKDIQLPSFDWYKASYLDELEEKLRFVRTSKGIKSSIRERKDNSNFETDSGFDMEYSVRRVSISKKGINNIVLSAPEKRELDVAENALVAGQFSNAKNLFSTILQKNPTNAKAYWGRFKATLKAKNDDAVPHTITANGAQAHFEDIDSAIDCSNDESFSWHIVDLLIRSLNTSVDWSKRKAVFDAVIKYLDDNRLEQVLNILSENAFAYLNSNVKTAEDVFNSSRKLFFNENKSKALEYMRKFADGLYEKKYFEQARKYYEELSSLQRNPDVYLRLLGCRIKALDITQAKFVLDINPDDDASAKKASELDLDEIIERAIICNNEQNNQLIAEQIKEMVLYQIVHNRKNAKPFIETVVSCYVQLSQEEEAIEFLMQVSERFIQLKNFKQAKIYYNEIIIRNPNYSKAHWGLLMCRFKVFDENQLIKKRKILLNVQEYNNAISCATENEYRHYSAIFNGEVQYYKNPYPTKKEAKEQARLEVAQEQAKASNVEANGKKALREMMMANGMTEEQINSYFEKQALQQQTASEAPQENENNKVKDPNKRAYLHFTKAKRRLRTCLVLATCAVLLVLAVCTVFGVKNSISYSVNDGYATVTGTNMFFDMAVNDLTVDKYKNYPIIEIKNEGFKGKKLKTLTLSESVTTIGDSAFENCTELTSVSILGETIIIGDNAFANCTSLTSLTFGETDENLSRAFSGIYLGNYAFKNCKLEKIEISNVKVIGANVFENCSNLKEIVLELNDGDYVDSKAFAGLSPNTVIYIPSVSIEMYSKITTSNPSLTVKKYTVDSVDECIFFINKIGTVTLNSREAIVKAERLYNNLTLSQRTKVTNYNSLRSARKIYDVMINIERIGTVTLNSNSAITTAENGYNRLTTQERFAVANSSKLRSARKVYDVMDKINRIGTVNLNSGSAIMAAENSYYDLTSQEKTAVSNYSTLTEAKSRYKVINVIDLIDKIGTITLNSGSAITAAENGYNKLSTDEKTQIDNYSILNSARKVFDVMVKIDVIGNVTLDSNNAITAAESGYIGLTATEKSAVSNYSTLTKARESFIYLSQFKFTLLDDNSYAVAAASSSLNGAIELPREYNNKSVTSIVDYAFRNCSELTSITIPNSITRIGNYAFMGCSCITSITIPNSVTSIGKAAFRGCSGLTSMILPFVGTSTSTTTTSLFGEIFGSSEFSGSTATAQIISIGMGTTTYYIPTSLKSVTVNGEKIPYGAFSNCSGLTSITIGNGVTEIDDYAFKNCSGLTSITIPDRVTSIGDSAFEGCSKLESVIFGNSVTSIGIDAFNGCSRLTSVTFKNTSGWRVTKNAIFTFGTSVSVTDNSQNATYLKSTYLEYYWKRK